MPVEGIMLAQEWNKSDMAYTGARLIDLSRRYLWFIAPQPRFYNYLSDGFLPAIKTHRFGSDSVWLRGQGLDLEFRWPLPLASLEESAESILEEPEPAFIFHDNSLGVLLPSTRSFMYATLEGMTNELAEVYKLIISRNEVGVVELIYPRDRYAKPMGTAVLITN